MHMVHLPDDLSARNHPCCLQEDAAEAAAAGAMSRMPTAAETDHILEVLREDVETALTGAAMAQERQALLQLEVGRAERLSHRSASTGHRTGLLWMGFTGMEGSSVGHQR